MYFFEEELIKLNLVLQLNLIMLEKVVIVLKDELLVGEVKVL